MAFAISSVTVVVLQSVHSASLSSFDTIVLDPIKVFEGHKNLGHERPFAAVGIIFNHEPPAAVRTQLLLPSFFSTFSNCKLPIAKSELLLINIFSSFKENSYVRRKYDEYLKVKRNFCTLFNFVVALVV